MADHVIVNKSLVVGDDWVRVDLVSAKDRQPYPFSSLAVLNAKTTDNGGASVSPGVNLHLSFNGGNSYATIALGGQYIVPETVFGPLYIRADPDGVPSMTVRCEMGATVQSP